MPNYSAPTISQIEDWAGLHFESLALPENELDELLVELRAQGEAYVALTLGEATFDGTLTARQVTTLQEAVALATGIRFLRSPKIRKLTGTHEPLLTEESGSYDEAISDFQDEIDRLIALVETGGDGTPSVGAPSFSSGTFTYEPTSDRTPYERNLLLDESDEVSASDEETG